MSRAKRPSAACLNAAALAVLPQLLADWLPDGEKRGQLYFARNPKRHDRNLGAFHVEFATGNWRDYAINHGGRDLISLRAYLFHDGNYEAAIAALMADPLVSAAVATGITAPPAKLANTANSPEAKNARVQELYASATALAGTPAAAYLASRGLRPTPVWSALKAAKLHYLREGKLPALVAPIQDLDGRLVGLHRTFLRVDGTKLNVPNPRLTLGQVRGGAIRLGEPGDQLIICEGLEDGLTLNQELRLPVWVAGGAAFLHLMRLPETVRTLTIAADNDAAGDSAAARAAVTHGQTYRVVRIMRPAARYKDFNDELRDLPHGE